MHPNTIKGENLYRATQETNISPMIEIVPDVDEEQALKEKVLVSYFLTGQINRCVSDCRVKKEKVLEILEETKNDDLSEYREKAYKQIIDKQLAIVRMLQDAEFKKVQQILNDSQNKLSMVKTSDLAAAFKTNYQVLEFMKVFTANKDQITVNNINVDADAIKKLEDIE